jgi:hypothetical protein
VSVRAAEIAAEPGVALAGGAGGVLPAGLDGARGEFRPGDEVAGGGEDAHVQADLGEDDLRGVLRYLMLRLNNQIIKLQYTLVACGLLSNLRLEYGCKPFDAMPFCTSLIRHSPRFADLAESLDASGRTHEILARRMKINVEDRGMLYTPVADLADLGDVDQLIATYNGKLYYKHTGRKLLKDKGHVFIKDYEDGTVTIIQELQQHAAAGIAGYEAAVKQWLAQTTPAPDDPLKVKALQELFIDSQVALIYGAAGTGKSTMVSLIANYFNGNEKLFLAHTNPAVDNLKRRVKAQRDDEIILCLNYDGLYGINNVNRFLQSSNPGTATVWGASTYKVGDPVLFNDTDRFRPVIYNNLKGKIVDIQTFPGRIQFDVSLDRPVTAFDVDGIQLRYVKDSTVPFDVYERGNGDDDDDSTTGSVPFQVAYAVSIHKAQGLEYDSVKVVITDANEDDISHNVFYTAITRAREHLQIFWTPETEHAVLSSVPQRPRPAVAHQLAQI